MVIGFDGSRAFLKDKTGTENYSFQLLLNLAKIDKQNHYIVYLKTKTITSTIVPHIENFPQNFTFKEIHWFRFWTQGGLALQTFIDNLDVLFVPAHTLPILRRPSLKTVMTVHDLGAEYLPSLHQLKQRLYLSFITRFQLKSATKLIAVSQSTKRDLLEKMGIDAKNIKVIYEGVNTQLFLSVKGDNLRNILNKYDIKKDRYFLFVGTIQPRKNLVRLIKAFYNVIAIHQKIVSSSGVRRNPCNDELNLVLVGSKGWMSDEIYALPKKLGIEEKVKFLGHVSDDDLAALYLGATAFVYPSLFEGFGLPILEAFSCRCPVLTSNVSSMPEVAGGAALLVNPENVGEITNGMIKLVTDHDLQSKLTKRGFKQVERFSWEKCAKQTLNLFISIKP